MSTSKTPPKTVEVNPNLDEVLGLATKTAKGQLPADGRSSAKASLGTEVTSFGADGNGETKSTTVDASVSLGQTSSTKTVTKPAAE